MRMNGYGEPLWCEDCRYFRPIDMGGEGECDHKNPRSDVWYGRFACSGFEPKEEA